jgi:formylmethanofuran dehydrogenase subunit C
MALVIEPRDGGAGGPLSIDLTGIVPGLRAGHAAPAIAALPIGAGTGTVALGSLFALRGDATDGVVICRGDFSGVHGIAAGMDRGTVEVVGDVGRHAGAGMTGGRLLVTGNAGDWLAAGMAGGEVVVGGDVGDHAAAALPGADRGPTGGRVLVAGDAGAFAAGRMRRGIVMVAGSCGPGAAFELRAGTLVTNRVGAGSAVGMQRGSVVILDHAAAPPGASVGFFAGRAWDPPFLRLLAGSLPDAVPWVGVAAALRCGRWRQWHGDPLHGGRGEVLQAEPWG